MSKNYVAIRSIALDCGLHYYEVIHMDIIQEQTGHTPVFEHNHIDSHWQESTARLCAARWAEYYGCPIYNKPLQAVFGEVVLR